MSKMPVAGRNIIDLHLSNARSTAIDAFAERSLAEATSMQAYAMACGHMTAAEYSNEQVTIKLIREQRKNRACAA